MSVAQQSPHVILKDGNKTLRDGKMVLVAFLVKVVSHILPRGKSVS
jgi:hypothetical protein